MDNHGSFERGGHNQEIADQDISAKVFDKLLVSWAQYNEAWNSELIDTFAEAEVSTEMFDSMFNEISVSIKSVTGEQPDPDGKYTFEICENICDTSCSIAHITVDDQHKIKFTDPVDGKKLNPQRQNNLDIILSLMNTQLVMVTPGVEEEMRELDSKSSEATSPAQRRRVLDKIATDGYKECNVNTHKKQIKDILEEILYTLEGYDGETADLVKPRQFQTGDSLVVPVSQGSNGEQWSAALTELVYDEESWVGEIVKAKRNRVFELVVSVDTGNEPEQVKIQCFITISPFEVNNLAVVEGGIPEMGYALIDETLTRIRIALACQSESGYLLWFRPIGSTAT